MEKRSVDVPNVLKDNAEILLTALRKVVVCHARVNMQIESLALLVTKV